MMVEEINVESGRRRCSEKVKVYLTIGIVSLLAAAGLVLALQFVGKSTSGSSGANKYSAFICDSELSIPVVNAGELKGLVVDDATFECPGAMPIKWPNTNVNVQYLRIFRAAQPGWKDSQISDFADSLAEYTHQTHAKVLVGTQITCFQMDDQVDWSNVKALMKKLGREHVLGLAIGNELDQLAGKDGITMDCIDRIWNGYLLDTIKQRVDDLISAMPEFEDLPITSVFTGAVIWPQGGDTAFTDTREMKVNTFLSAVIKQQKNWVYAFNFYPYFDPNLRMDADDVHCQAAMANSKCLDKASCEVVANLVQARRRMQLLTGSWTDRLWIGEMGWSSPMSATLRVGGGAMSHCSDFSDMQMFKDYYTGFLEWDLTIPSPSDQKFIRPEIAFYFSMRDSANFGQTEYFGLIPTCGDKKCKLQKPAQCATDLQLAPARKQMAKKGLALDDATMECLDEMMDVWPNTDGEQVEMLRTFRSSKPGWTDDKIAAFQQKVVAYAGRNGARVLVGTQISCDEAADDRDWSYALQLAKMLGSAQLLGVAVGNEIDMLSTQGAPMDCIDKIWSSYLLEKITSRYNDLRKNKLTVPITSVFTGMIVWSGTDLPFMDTREVKANTFINAVIDPKRGLPWVFTINFYPYFDPNIKLDEDGKHCTAAIAGAKCFDKEACLTTLNLKRALDMIGRVSQAAQVGWPLELWIGEVGWSAPRADNLMSVMKNCDDFSSYGMFRDYYEGFLNWDMSVPGAKAVQYAFYFSMKDSNNFNVNEHFGLASKCGDPELQCKLDKSKLGPAATFRSQPAEQNISFTWL